MANYPVPFEILNHAGIYFSPFNNVRFGLEYVYQLNGNIGKEIHGKGGNGIQHSPPPWSFIISVDTPFISLEVISELTNEGVSIVIPSVNKKALLLVGYYNKHTLPFFEKEFERGSYKLMDVLKKVDSILIELPQFAKELANINTKEQLLRHKG